MKEQQIYTMIVCNQAILLPCKPHPLLPSRGLDLISLEKEACVHIPHPPVLPQNSIVYFLLFFFLPPPPPLNLLSLSARRKKN